MSCTLHDKPDIVLLHEVNGFNDMVNRSDVDRVWHVCTDLTRSLSRIKGVTTFVEEDGVHDGRWVGYTVKAMLRRDTESYRKLGHELEVRYVPVLSDVIALFFVIGRVMAWTTDRYGLDDTTVNGMIEGIPYFSGRP